MDTMTHPAAAPPVKLDIDKLSKHFGGVCAVDALSFTYAGGGVVGLIGPNGAGKTTLFNLLSGQDVPTLGTVSIDGVRLSGRPPHEAIEFGVARTFQNLQIFSSLSVLDNVYVADAAARGSSPIVAMLGLEGRGRRLAAAMDRARMLLLRAGLGAEYHDRPAGSLAYGLQRRVEIARALATGPRLLLLDEPLAGLSRAESQDLLQLMREIAATGVTVMLVEHDVASVMDVCTYILVLDRGRKLAEGLPADVRADARVRAAYLGEDDQS